MLTISKLTITTNVKGRLWSLIPVNMNKVVMKILQVLQAPRVRPSTILALYKYFIDIDIDISTVTQTMLGRLTVPIISYTADL